MFFVVSELEKIIWKSLINITNKVEITNEFAIIEAFEKVVISLTNDKGKIIAKAKHKYIKSSALFPVVWKACSKNFIKKITYDTQHPI